MLGDVERKREQVLMRVPRKAALACAPSCGAGWREAGGFVELPGDLGRAVAGADGLDGRTERCGGSAAGRWTAVPLGGDRKSPPKYRERQNGRGAR